MSLQHGYELLNQKQYQRAMRELEAEPETEKNAVALAHAHAICMFHLDGISTAKAFLEEKLDELHAPLQLVVDYLQLSMHENTADTGLDKAATWCENKADLTNAPSELIDIILRCGISSAHATLLTRLVLANKLNANRVKQCIDWLKQRQHYDQALALTEYLLTSKKDNATLMDKAIILRLAGKPQQALPILNSLDAQMQHFAIKHNIGNAYADLGDLENARDYFGRAIALREDYIDSHINYHSMNWELGETDLYGDTLQHLIDKKAVYPQSLFALLNLLMQAKQYDRALALLEREKCHLDAASTHHFKIKLHSYMGNYTQAMDAVSALESQQQLGPELLLEKSNILIGLGLFKDAVQLLRDLLDTELPLNLQNITRANVNTCKRFLGEPTVDMDQIRQFTFTPQQANSSLGDVIAEVTKLHTSKNSPLNQSVSGGSQTRGNLFPARTKLLEQVETFIKNCAVNYLQDEKTALSRTLKSTDDVFFTGSWSVLLKGEGFHTSHYHSKAHLSGVIYLVVPECVNDTSNKAGWLHFGQPWLNHSAHIEPECFVRPEPGKLVLFPSHTWHGTQPITENATRLTIAFDILLR